MKTPTDQGGEFRFNRFYKEFAIGTGIGFRFDFNFAVVRLDLAWPLHIPSLEEGDRWVADEIDFFSSDWRRSNLLWNFGISYPF